MAREGWTDAMVARGRKRLATGILPTHGRQLEDE